MDDCDVPSMSMFWKEDQPATSIKSKNKSVAQYLPDRNSPIYQAATDFLKFLLDRTILEAPYPSEPTPEEISQFSKLPDLTFEKIMADQSIFSFSLEPAAISSPTCKISRRQKDCWEIHKQRFLHDLTTFGIPRVTLAWTLPETAPWNQAILSFAVKHFEEAMRRGAFSKYPITRKPEGPLTSLGIFERWLRGRFVEISKRKRHCHSNHQMHEKIRKRRTKLLEYCQNTIEACLDIPPSKLLPNGTCCSDTEDESPEKLRAVGVHWRSDEYANLLHKIDELSYHHQKDTKGARWAALRMDSRRQPALRINHSRPVPKNLPENFYSPVFLSKLSATDRGILTRKPPSSLLSDSISQIQSLLVQMDYNSQR